MDPKACLELAVDLMTERDYPGARERLVAYRRWRRFLGYEPTMDDGTKGDDRAQAILDALNSGYTLKGA